MFWLYKSHFLFQVNGKKETFSLFISRISSASLPSQRSVAGYCFSWFSPYEYESVRNIVTTAMKFCYTKIMLRSPINKLNFVWSAKRIDNKLNILFLFDYSWVIEESLTSLKRMIKIFFQVLHPDNDFIGLLLKIFQLAGDKALILFIIISQKGNKLICFSWCQFGFRFISFEYFIENILALIWNSRPSNFLKKLLRLVLNVLDTCSFNSHNFF